MRLLDLLLLLTAGAHAQRMAQGSDRRWVGELDRFWKHHVAEESLIVEGENQYHNIKNCLDASLSDDEHKLMDTVRADRSVGMRLREGSTTYLIAIRHAMHPVHTVAVQNLARCVRKYVPSSYESRAMFVEFGLDKDPGLGGNCPTHLAPLVSIFLPSVLAEMRRTLKMAYDAAGWERVRLSDHADPEMNFSQRLCKPEQAGVRASEHLTYSDFPTLAEHNDGDATAFTLNYAFSDDYEGGQFFIKDLSGKTHTVKPPKYDAMVFLGGRYLHGVNEITSGHREMFSTELWTYPDLPFGGTLWSSYPENMEWYIRECNKEAAASNTTGAPCRAKFGLDSEDRLETQSSKYAPPKSEAPRRVEDDRNDDDDDADTRYFDETRPDRVRPQPLLATNFIDETGKKYHIKDFLPVSKSEDFLVPRELAPGQMEPIRWRASLNPVGGSEGESFVIGFPEELHKEFVDYVAKSGMMRVAHQLLYKERQLEPGEHKIYTLDDGEKWGAMIQGDWDTDMVWLDPADESCFESLLGVLRRGGFDTVLEKLGETFDLKSLMVQGIGAIFLSDYQKLDNIHTDVDGSKGSFYNVIVPVHIPANDVARFYVGDDGDDVGTLNLDPRFGVVLGGESHHGTGECNYRENEDFRLSFAVYVADISKDNVELIASDSTSLWPTQGDVDWFWAQQGRLWKANDSSVSLKNDKGRKRMHVRDKVRNCDPDRCESDPQGMRLKCPLTCKLYLEDHVYYEKIAGQVSSDAAKTTTISAQ